MPKRVNDRIAIGCIFAAVFLGTIGVLWLQSGSGKADDVAEPISKSELKPAEIQETTTEAASPRKLSDAEFGRIQGQVVATTQSLIREHMKTGKSAMFLPDAKVGPAFDGKLLVSGLVDGEMTTGTREKLPYEAYVILHSKTAQVELWMVEINGRALYMSDDAKAFRDFGGNRFAGTHQQEREWSRAVKAAEDVVRRKLAKPIRTTGEARNGGPWCMQADQTWSVGGTAFTEDGGEHTFSAEVSRKSGKVLSYSIDDVDYDPRFLPQ